ncbi:uridine kinase family protein [Nostoc sp.]|uniref:uridine kinase family protein n=1 Tax=Nostoc sp. TaxID=1180 RepID=UPI002FF5B3E3
MGRSTRYQRYNWETGCLGDWVEVKPEEIQLVEGVYTFRPELQKYYDFSIFVATPQSERLKRMISRQQNSSEWIHRWMAAEDWYLNTVNPKDAANLILSEDNS